MTHLAELNENFDKTVEASDLKYQQIEEQTFQIESFIEEDREFKHQLSLIRREEIKMLEQTIIKKINEQQ